MKKLFFSAMIFFMVFVLVGCGETENKEIIPNNEKVHSAENYYKPVEEEVVALSTKNDNKLHPSYLKNYYKVNYWEEDFDWDGDENWIEESYDGKYFGYEEDFWAGCSGWCSVSDYYCNITASSTLASQGKYSYEAENLAEKNREKAWVEGESGDGIGEYIKVKQMCLVNGPHYRTDIGFKEICIVNGYTATMKNWVENSRVKELKMYFDGKYVANIELEDTMKPQYIDISSLGLKVQNGEEATFKFEIADVYKGDKYDDTALTGLIIDFTGMTGH